MYNELFKGMQVIGPQVICSQSTVQQYSLCAYSFFFFFFSFLGPHPWHMGVPRLGVKSELQLLVYTTATATPDPSLVCDLHHSSQHHQILDPLSKARDGTCILMDPSLVRFAAPQRELPIQCSVFFHFLWLYLWHMEVPELGVYLELLAYATDTLNPSCICDLCCSLQQCLILNPLSKPRDQTHILTETMSDS